MDKLTNLCHSFCHFYLKEELENSNLRVIDNFLDFDSSLQNKILSICAASCDDYLDVTNSVNILNLLHISYLKYQFQKELTSDIDALEDFLSDIDGIFVGITNAAKNYFSQDINKLLAHGSRKTD